MRAALILLFALQSIAVGTPPDQGSAADWNNRGSILYSQHHYAAAEPYFQTALSMALRNEIDNRRQLATIYLNLAAVTRMQARLKDAEALYWKAVEYSGGWPTRNAQGYAAFRGLALLCSSEGRLPEAEEYARRALALRKLAAEDATGIAESTNDLAIILFEAGKYEPAEKLARDALASISSVDCSEQLVSGYALNLLGRISLARGDSRSAETYFSQAAVLLTRVLGSDNPAAAAIWGNLGEARARSGEWRSAIDLMNKSIGTLERSYGPRHPEIASALNNLATVYKNRKQYDRARQLYERAFEIDCAVLGADSVRAAAPAARPEMGRKTPNSIRPL